MAFYSRVFRPAAALNIPSFVPFPWLRESPGLPLFVPQPGNSLKTTGWTLWASCFTLISLGSLYLFPNVQSLKRTSCHMFCFALLCWLFQAGRSICGGGAFFLATKLCPTLCNPMDCNKPGFPVLHQPLELVQTHVHWVSDVIQSSHPLSSPSPPALNLSQHHGLFQWVGSSHQVAKVLELQLLHQFNPCHS